MHPIRILQRGRNDTAQFEVQLVDINKKKFLINWILLYFCKNLNDLRSVQIIVAL